MSKSNKPARRNGRNGHHQLLIDLEIEDQDLDKLADYFGLVFEYDPRPMTVLVALLDRLVAVEKSKELHLEDIVTFLSRRLFAKCMDGERAAGRFQQNARQRALIIVEEPV